MRALSRFPIAQQTKFKCLNILYLLSLNSVKLHKWNDFILPSNCLQFFYIDSPFHAELQTTQRFWTGGPCLYDKTTKRNKRHTDLSALLNTDNMIVYIEIPMVPTKKLLKLISELCRSKNCMCMSIYKTKLYFYVQAMNS